MSVEKTTYEFNYIDKGKQAMSGTASNFKKLDGAVNDFEHNYDKSTKNVEANTSRMRKGVSALSSEFPMLGRAAAFAASPLGIAAITIGGISAVLLKGAEHAKVFNHNFLELKNLNLDKTQAQIDDLRDSVLDTSFENGFDVNKTVKAYFDVQSATGKYGQEVDKIVSKVGVFSRTMGVDFNEAILGTSKALDVFKIGAADIDDYLGSWAKTVQFGITTFDELSKVQTEFIGAAAASGQGYDEANKVFAAFTKTSKNVDIAATMTKGAFEDLKKLEKINIKVFEDGQYRKVDSILADVNSKFSELSDQDISNLIEDVGGNEGLRGLLKNIQNSGDQVLETFKEFDNLEFDFDKALENANGDLETMEEIVNGKLSAAWVRLGDTIMPILVEFKSWLADVLDWTNDVVENINSWRKYNGLQTAEDRKKFRDDNWVEDSKNDRLAQYQAEANALEGEARDKRIKQITDNLKFSIRDDAKRLDLLNNPDPSAYNDYDYKNESKYWEETWPGREWEYEAPSNKERERLKNQYSLNVRRDKEILKQWEEFLNPKTTENDEVFKDPNPQPTLNGVTVAGEKIRNVTVNIENVVREMMVNNNTAADMQDMVERVSELLVRSIRDAELVLSSE